VPTYQYACTACADRLEVVQAFVDEPLTQCPSCGGRLRKVFSPVGVVFKGSGFYKNDSRAAAKKAADAAASTSAPGAAGSSGDSGTGAGDKSGSDGDAKTAPAAAKSAEGAATPSASTTKSATSSTATKAPARSG
jgi:putative FmdB family regulatory protein